MSKRVLIGLLAVSVVAMWVSAANAFNRILGASFSHGTLIVDVELCGDPLVDTVLTIDLQATVEIECANPQGRIPPGPLGHQQFNITVEASQTVRTGEFAAQPACDSGQLSNTRTAQKQFVIVLPECRLRKFFTKVSESSKNVTATIAWCPNPANDPACQQPIEVVQAQCEEVTAEVPCVEEGTDLEHVGPPGDPPPPLEQPPIIIP